ncbi:MAG: GTPase Era [Bacteroidota bacterium]|nr:GTPase Era [Bacteroidota bacterium]
MTELVHKSGFVTIIGCPNAGKSTLMNAFLGEKLSIVTPKAQTTRHRILGILNEPDYQIVFSDTPGIIKPHYELHKSMMKFVSYSLEDADLVLVMHDLTEDNFDSDLLEKCKKIEVTKFLILNKNDLVNQKEIEKYHADEEFKSVFADIIDISAINRINISFLLSRILEKIPTHPAYYDKEELTDKPERFFASEIIREKILLNYQQEIPYSCEVLINSFKEKENVIVISAEIIVERDSQKGILIGKNGESLKKMATDARLELEKFFDKKIFLETHVKVAKDWRKSINHLSKFGYNQK